MKTLSIVMILNLVVFLAKAETYVFVSNPTAEQIRLRHDTESNWIANGDVTAAQGFSAIRKLMSDDPVIQTFVQKITEKLQSHGVQELEDVVRICPPDDSTASGYTNFSPKVVEARPKLPGQPDVQWSDGALQSMRNAFSYRIISKPFMEYLVVQNLPTVCVKADEKIRRAYGIFIHEFVHFSQQDPFEDVIPKDTFEMDNFLNSMILRKGGELDAFKMQISAEIGLLGRMGILNPNANYPFAYANLNGEITDVDGLRQYIFTAYATLLDTAGTKSNEIKRVYENNVYRAAFLKQRVVPHLIALNDISSVDVAQAEITKIEAANAKIRTVYPDFF